jgi:nucleotide-binding universal stress UspA family protein
MSRCILVGVDATLSLSTWSALESVCQCLEQSPSECHLLLLHVIPVPSDPAPRWGRPIGSVSTLPPTQRQLHEAKYVLLRARALLGQLGVPLASVELLVRTGIPAEELARVARERDVELLVLGSRPHSRLGLLWRLLLGSTSRRATHLAPCRVLLAHPTCPFDSSELVTWYEQALLRCLQQEDALMVLTPGEVAQRFTPGVRAIGHREVEAAASALHQLANRGVLLCQVIQGEVRCWND